MKKIEVKRTVHIEYKYPSPNAPKTPATKNFAGTYVAVRSTAYLSETKPVLIQCICDDWKQYFQRSEDNGRTWRRSGEEWDNDDGWYMPAVWDPDYDGSSAGKNKEAAVRMAPVFFLDPAEHFLLRIYSRAEFTEDSPFKDTMFELALSHVVMYQISSDEGRNWSQPRQIIQKGAGYDKKHWGRDMCLGKQGGHIPVTPVSKLDNGNICVPFCRNLARNGRFIIEGACLLGHWQKDSAEFEWDIGDYVSVDPKLSAMGADEPCIAKLSDGRLFMILRGSGSEITNLPSFKYYSVSENNGKTWSAAKVLTYLNGDVAYSPRCLAHALCSSKNNRLYVITNFLEHATKECLCDPRHPLQIAEVNQESFCVIPETVTVIEDRKPEMGEPENIRFSNWQWHEDRETRDIVLYMTSCPGVNHKPSDCGCPMHSYRYDIHLPEE